MNCELEHIPGELHKGNKVTIESFEVGEEIYRRCSAEQLENPFIGGVSICELSVNRRGIAPDFISQPNDVLLNITGIGDPILNKVVCTLTIKDLHPVSNTYEKSFEQTKENPQTHLPVLYRASMKLIHEPEICMYPHCVFRVWLNGELVTMDNYRGTIYKVKKIKTELQMALVEMIVQRQISQEKIILQA
ncbi:hypothetical protein BH09BAC5_BH09BAC5_00760 [soil metagenome]